MIYVVFASQAAFNTFKAATPQTDENPFTKIGSPAYEFHGDEDTPPSGRVIVAHDFTGDECEYLQARGADVRMGGIDGPVWPGEVLP